MSHEIKHLPIFGWSERTETALWNVCNMCEMLSIIDTRFQVCKLSHSFSLLDHDSDPLCQSVDKRSQPSNRNGKLICQMWTGLWVHRGINSGLISTFWFQAMQGTNSLEKVRSMKSPLPDHTALAIFLCRDTGGGKMKWMIGDMVS